jgi:hypothetical protein
MQTKCSFASVESKKMDWFDEDNDVFTYVVCLFNGSLIIKHCVFSSRSPSKSNITSKNELTGLRAKGNYHPQTPSKPKGSSSKKPFEGDAESDSDNDVISISNSKASGKQIIKSKSHLHTDSDNEALMSPFEHVDPRRSNKTRR